MKIMDMCKYVGVMFCEVSAHTFKGQGPGPSHCSSSCHIHHENVTGYNSHTEPILNGGLLVPRKVGGYFNANKLPTSVGNDWTSQNQANCQAPGTSLKPDNLARNTVLRTHELNHALLPGKASVTMRPWKLPPLGYVGALLSQHGEQRLRALQNLHVCKLGLLRSQQMLFGVANVPAAFWR